MKKTIKEVIEISYYPYFLDENNPPKKMRRTFHYENWYKRDIELAKVFLSLAKEYPSLVLIDFRAISRG